MEPTKRGYLENIVVGQSRDDLISFIFVACSVLAISSCFIGCAVCVCRVRAHRTDYDDLGDDLKNDPGAAAPSKLKWIQKRVKWYNMMGNAVQKKRVRVAVKMQIETHVLEETEGDGMESNDGDYGMIINTDMMDIDEEDEHEMDGYSHDHHRNGRHSRHRSTFSHLSVGRNHLQLGRSDTLATDTNDRQNEDLYKISPQIREQIAPEIREEHPLLLDDDGNAANSMDAGTPRNSVDEHNLNNRGRNPLENIPSNDNESLYNDDNDQNDDDNIIGNTLPGPPELCNIPSNDTGGNESLYSGDYIANGDGDNYKTPRPPPRRKTTVVSEASSAHISPEMIQMHSNPTSNLTVNLAVNLAVNLDDECKDVSVTRDVDELIDEPSEQEIESVQDIEMTDDIAMAVGSYISSVYNENDDEKVDHFTPGDDDVLLMAIDTKRH